ncbi:MAG: TIGR02302 family protein [Reyranella sp.]|uniref:TIGR02302 family protein n=1 Tax=Reyranella sp. TaxID=1929291 RepID=UPI001AD292A2|nr:TIGR02302 family protein [Reyranella sp.]MBN9085488.1 TIGR02302 family protein [Reyranella sp.]
MDATEATPIAAPGVERKIGLAWAALAWEGLWPRLMPLLAIAALFVAAAHLDLFGGLDPWVHTGVLAALALGVIGIAWWRFRTFAWPVRAEAIRRLEQDSGVPHRPLLAVQDQLAMGGHDRMVAALWEAHRRREAERLASLSNGPARPGLAKFDTWALRLVPLLALVVAVASAGGWRADRMAAAFTPAFPPPPPVVANLWIAPPAYTGKPPIYLDMADKDKVLRVPVGSKLAGFVDDVRGRHPPKLVIDGNETEFGTVSQGKYQVESVITEGSKISLQARGDEQARWKLHVIPDLAPTIEFSKPIGVDKWSTRIEYIGGDDFGITGVQLQIRLHGSVLGAEMLDDGEEPEVMRIDLPVPGNSKKVSDAFVRDLTSHPWAGLKVRVMLFATDALGQKGASTPETFLLPERVFNDPTARALIVLRKQLTRNPKGLRLDVADGMRLVQAHPASYRDDPVVQLGLRVGAARLAADDSKPTVVDSQKLLWDLAMRLEQGATTDAERAVEQARQELRDAMQRQAGDEEIEKLIQQLYSAMDRWQKEMAERMKDPEERRRMEEQAQRMDPNNTITGDDLQKMLDKIREMAKNGQREEAKRLLEELRKMMENATPMMAQPGQRGQQRQQQGQNGQGNQQGREMMNQLDRLSRRQNQLLGESEREGRQQQQQGQRGQQGQQGQQGQRGQQGQQGQQGQGQQGEGQQWGENQGNQQGHLRGQLGDLMKKLDENGMPMPESLGRAERSMREAEDALRRGDPREASRAQRRALDNLQQGMGDMAEQMRQRGPGNGQDIAEIEERERRGEDRDPLGRSDGNFGDSVDTGVDKVPLELERQKSREILDELRRRAGEMQRPKEELDYIDRLLKTY